MQKITISGQVATCHVSQYQTEEVIINHSINIALILKELEYLRESNKNLLIGIEGKPDSGKTILAMVLGRLQNDTTILDMFAASESEEPLPDWASSKIITNKMKYLVNEEGYKLSSLYPSITEHVNNGGSMVLFIQDKRHIELDIDITWFKLTHDGLTRSI
jgi:hypothetical protein